MAEPTVYKTPKKSIPGNTPTTKDKHLWDKHRVSKNKNTKVPKTKK